MASSPWPAIRRERKSLSARITPLHHLAPLPPPRRSPGGGELRNKRVHRVAESNRGLKRYRVSRVFAIRDSSSLSDKGRICMCNSVLSHVSRAASHCAISSPLSRSLYLPLLLSFSLGHACRGHVNETECERQRAILSPLAGSSNGTERALSTKAAGDPGATRI